MATVTVYHRTTLEAAREIESTGRFRSREGHDVFVSNRRDGQASGYGQAVVVLQVPESWLRLDDEFPDGEQHFALDARRITKANIVSSNPADVDEQVVTPDGEVCVLKDCCILICDNVVTPNPGRGAFTDRAVIDRAFNAVCGGIEKGYGLARAEQVAAVLYALPINYNARLQRAIGRAKFKNDKGVPSPTVIELTGSVDIPADYMHGLLVHEGCHVACCVLAGPAFNYEQGHGRRWKDLMTAAGERPEAQCSDPRVLNHERQAKLDEKRRLRKGGPAVELTAADFQPGDNVSFIFKNERVFAKVMAKESHHATVEYIDENGQFHRLHPRWRIGYGLLTKEPA